MLSPRDLGWVAGFLEGEGSFLDGGRARLRVQATQVEEAPIQRLIALLGGKAWLCRTRHGAQPIWAWTLRGAAAAGLMMTLWVLMSPRRRDQIETALASWKCRRVWNPKGLWSLA